MKLPHVDKAFIPESKISDYLLSETHSAGRTKANFFRGLGFDEENLDELKQALLKLARKQEVQKEITSSHGIKYVIEGWLQAPVKTVRV